MAIKTHMWANCKLEVLDFEESRTVLKDMNDDGTVKDLVISVDTVARLALRINGGPVFTVTVDSKAVDDVIIPWIKTQCSAGCGRDGSVRVAEDMMVCGDAECMGKFRKLSDPGP